MKNLTIILLLFVLSGCGGIVESTIDPDGYTARSTADSDAAKAQADAQKAFAQSQQALAESEAQRAQAEAQARQAESQAQAQAAQSNAQAEIAQADAFAEMGRQIKESGEANKNLVLVAMLLLAGFAGFAVWNMQRVATVQQLQPPQSVQLIAAEHGLYPAFDGQRWLLLDERGVVVKQQKLLA